jgi:hypothetical protein
VTPELVLYHTPKFHRFPKFATLQVHGFESSASGLYDFATSKLHRSNVPSHRAFATPRLREFGTPDRRVFATPRLREFQTPDPRDFLVPENIFTNFMNLDVSRVTGFLNSPTLAPRGSGLTPTIRFHEHFRISLKKCHPRNVGGDTRHPGTSQRSNRGMFAELPPSPL